MGIGMGMVMSTAESTTDMEDIMAITVIGIIAIVQSNHQVKIPISTEKGQ